MRLIALSVTARRVAFASVLFPLLGASLPAVAADTPKKPAATAAPDAAKPPAQSAASKQAGQKALREAIAALQKDYVAWNGGEGKGRLRDKSDYFLANKSPDVTDEMIFAALLTNTAADAGADGYVKWQLLSGLSPAPIEKTAAQVLAAYNAGPQLFMRPGMSTSDKQELDAALRGVKGTDVETINKINDKLRELVAAWEKHNFAIINYRDALYAKLAPAAAETLMARLQDLYQRVAVGITSEAMGTVLHNSFRTFTASSPQPAQARVLADAVLKMINAMGGMPAKPAARGPERDGGLTTVAVVLGSDTRAPVILAAGKGGKSAAGNNNNYQNMGTFPPKYYDRVEFDAQKNQLLWQSEAAKFLKKDAVVALWADLDELASSNSGNKMK